METIQGKKYYAKPFENDWGIYCKETDELIDIYLEREGDAEVRKAIDWYDNDGYGERYNPAKK